VRLVRAPQVSRDYPVGALVSAMRAVKHAGHRHAAQSVDAGTGRTGGESALQHAPLPTAAPHANEAPQDGQFTVATVCDARGSCGNCIVPAAA
jgi:hypothetical protein